MYIISIVEDLKAMEKEDIKGIKDYASQSLNGIREILWTWREINVNEKFELKIEAHLKI